MSSSSIVIIGGGHAGLRAALSARESGHNGDITLITQEGEGCNYERPPLSKWKADDKQVTLKPIVPPNTIAEARIQFVADDVLSLDTNRKTLQLKTRGELQYHKLLLATGAGVRRISVPGAQGVDLLHLRDLADAKKIHKSAKNANSALIVGGGFIGLELAASLRSINVDVELIEAAERLLMRAISELVAKIVQDLHIKNGVKFHFNAKINEVSVDSNQKVVRLEDGTNLTADMLIIGIGSQPNMQLAQAAGLETANGIIVNQHMQTSDPDIFAAGDCCSFPLYEDSGPLTRLESWQAAGEQGDVAGRNMVASSNQSMSVYKSVPWFWSEQYDHMLQVAGLAQSGDTCIDRIYEDDHLVSFSMNPNGNISSACGIAKGMKIAKDIRFSMKMIEAKSSLSENDLMNPKVALKSLIRK